MALSVLMDKGIVRHIIKNTQDRSIAKTLLTENPEISDNMPINSIVVELVGITNIIDSSVQKDTRIACLPLFSSHISMPLKKGEAVWIISFEEKSEDNFNYYWLSRVHGDTATEDANFTSPNRLNTEKGVDTARAYNKSQLIEQEYNVADYPKFDNFITLPDESQVFIVSSNDREEQELERLTKSNNITLEPVPRYYKNEDELALQGSNNTLIALKTFDGYTSNREWDTQEYTSEDSFYGNINKVNVENDGFIDIVAGRSRFNTLPSSNDFFDINDVNNFQKTFTTSSFRTCYPTIVNSLGKFENNKNFENFLEETPRPNQEGKPDFNHDAARICLSENRNLDREFNIFSTFFNQFDMSFPQDFNLSTIVNKSDNIRLIARQNYINNNEFSSKSMSSIILLKEGISPNENRKGTQSFIALDEVGNIALDGVKIQLGSNLRVSDTHGNGDQVFIGQNNENSQPMVLGNTLKDMLDNLCQQFINFIEIFNNHGHASSAAIGPARGPNNPADIGQTVNDTSNISQEVNNIKENLITIQSKMAKLQ
jgi:hypothetical protein